MTNGTLHRIEKKLKAGKTTLLQLYQNDGKSASYIFDKEYNFDFSVLPNGFELEFESSHGFPRKLIVFQ